jgi:general secretion pathway protein D
LIIAYVDTETIGTTIPYVIYPLENQDPVELAAVLEQLVHETVTSKDAKGAKIEKTTKRTEDAPTIIADPKTYSLIVYASKKNQQWIGSLIKQLDQYRPQVLLDVSLVEITKNDEFNMDLDLVSKLPYLEPGVEGMSSAAVSALLTPFPTTTIREMMSKPAVEPLAGATAFYADRHIQALFELMQRKDYGRVLARPKLLVNDNWEGTIKAEEKTSIVKETTNIIPGSGTTSPTATTTVGFDSYTAGITLIITPHISKGDQLQLTVTLNRTDFRLKPDYELDGGTRTGPTPPDLLTSDVSTVVTVPNGKTIILGGLEKLTQTKGGAKVPFFGDIPLVGALFRTTSNKDTQSRLYVFVKAHILRPGEALTGTSDIEVVSLKNRATFERYEREMQEYENWPGIKPEPMDPLRVLETD